MATKRRVPALMLVTAAFLAVMSGVAGLIAYQEESWPVAASALVALVASVASALLLRWSQFLLHAFVIAASSFWAYSLYLSALNGYFGRRLTWDMFVILLPEAGLLLLGFCCSVFAFRQFRVRP